LPLFSSRWDFFFFRHASAFTNAIVWHFSIQIVSQVAVVNAFSGLHFHHLKGLANEFAFIPISRRIPQLFPP
jgi:hypothetical protein